MASFADIGTITAVELANNRDSEKKRYIATVQVTGDLDEKTVELWPAYGLDGMPPIGSRVLIVPVSSSYLVGIVADDGVEPSAASGERILYSTDPDGVVAARAHCKSDGNLVLNAGEDFAVRFSALETAFNQLQEDFGKLNDHYAGSMHVHVCAAPGSPTGPFVPPAPQITNTADIAPAKVETVLLP